MLEQPTVVLINNEPTFRWTVSRLLERQGFSVVAQERGPAALDLVRKSRPAAIILESSYGSAVSATSLVERLRANGESRYIPIIVCSADGKFLHSYGEYLRGQGCVVVGRPFNAEQFASLMQRATTLRTAPINQVLHGLSQRHAS